MNEKNENMVQNRFFQARRSYDGERRGLVRKWLPATLNRIFLRPGQIWLQSKADRAQEGTTPGMPTYFLLLQKLLGRLNGGNSPRNGQIHPKRVIRFPRGSNSP
jgi:hypothetical protein